MKIYYYKDKHGNFGDDLNPWIWDKLFPGTFDDDSGTLFLGIGTLLNDRVPEHANKIVFGSGLGYGNRPPKIDEKWKFYFVRGPQTAAQLGLPKSLAITDPAALVATVGFPRRSNRSGIAFIPHHVSAWNANWASICDSLGLRYIDPRWDVERVLSEIDGTETLITEAMHGAIIADTLRVPWVPVFLYDHILTSKWDDWSQSLGLSLNPTRIEGIWDADYNFSRADQVKIKVKRVFSRLGVNSESWTPPPAKSSQLEMDRFIEQFGRFVRSASPQLSDDFIFRSALERLEEATQAFKTDHANGSF